MINEFKSKEEYCIISVVPVLLETEKDWISVSGKLTRLEIGITTNKYKSLQNVRGFTFSVKHV